MTKTGRKKFVSNDEGVLCENIALKSSDKSKNLFAMKQKSSRIFVAEINGNCVGFFLIFINHNANIKLIYLFFCVK